jgi:uncharacterized protein
LSFRHANLQLMDHSASPLFPPPAVPLSLYRGQVMHMRLKPRTHRFTYDVFAVLVDLGRLDEAAKVSRCFGINRRAFVSFWEKDHGADDGSPLLPYIQNLMFNAGCDVPDIRVRMLCYPRILGYAFNPIAVYYVYDAHDSLRGIVYEVRNTFGQKHTYVAPLSQGELTEAGVRQERDKLFYVSPFMDMAMRYRFRLHPPTSKIAIRILEVDSEGPILAATFVGKGETLNTSNVLNTLIRLPLMPIKVIMGIHFEALRLWIKGMKIKTRPAPPPNVSHLPPSNV